MTTRFAVASRVAGHSTSARTAPNAAACAVDEPDAVSCSACGSALASSTRSHSAGSSASAHTRPTPAARSVCGASGLHAATATVRAPALHRSARSLGFWSAIVQRWHSACARDMGTGGGLFGFFCALFTSVGTS